MGLREHRKKLHLTQAQLAARTGIDQTTISDLEIGGNRNPSWNVVGKLARALCENPYVLFPIHDGTGTA